MCAVKKRSFQQQATVTFGAVYDDVSYRSFNVRIKVISDAFESWMFPFLFLFHSDKLCVRSFREIRFVPRAKLKGECALDIGATAKQSAASTKISRNWPRLSTISAYIQVAWKEGGETIRTRRQRPKGDIYYMECIYIKTHTHTVIVIRLTTSEYRKEMSVST